MSKTNVHIALSLEGNKECITPTQPVMFLAGPIRNAPKWHHEAVRHAIACNTNTFIAVPIRDVPEDIRAYTLTNSSAPFFDRQRAWEQHYLAQAAQGGCTVFYLPKEAEVKEFPDKIYAHITMMELGTALAMKAVLGSDFNLVIGTDGEFPEWRTILLDIEAIGNIPVCYTMEDTINTALNLIHG